MNRISFIRCFDAKDGYLNHDVNNETGDAGMDLRECLKKDFNIDFPISGRTANSQDDPIVIHRQEPNDYTAVEYGILRCVGLARGVEWELVEQRFLDHKGRHLDQLTIETKETTQTQVITQLESYYFDITECVDLDRTDNGGIGGAA